MTRTRRSRRGFGLGRVVRPFVDELLESRRLLAANVAEPVTDVDTRPASSSLNHLVEVNGTPFFATDTAVRGTELWTSAGTEAGTELVRDIRPGSSSAFPPAPAWFTNVNGTLFFTADNGVNGSELWKSDGTEAGTVLVRDIRPGGSSALPSTSSSWFTNVNGTLFFTADDGVSGTELWKSDGTEAGTVQVRDINPGSASSSPRNLTNVNGTLFFRAVDDVSGTELWKSDGTEAGTVRVRDISPGTSSSTPLNLTTVNGALFFMADDGVSGRELWKSDGTEAGTVRVRDILPGIGSSTPLGLTLNFTNVNGTLFFAASDGVSGLELWKSDGTEAGTVRVRDIWPGSSSAFPTPLLSSPPSGFTNVDGTLFFTANDGVSGTELWKSDGTEAGTVRVKDILPGSAGSSPLNLASVNGTLFFAANEGVSGFELWRSDGTEAGTVRVRDIWPGTSSALSNLFSSWFTNVNGTLFFTANDGVSGTELWKSDGTEAGTLRVGDIWPGGGSSTPRDLTNVNGTLFFTADDGIHGRELWKLGAGDTIAPAVSSMSFAFEIAHQLAVNFSEPIDPTSLNLSSVTASRIGQAGSVTPQSVTWSAGNTVATFTFPLLADGDYRFALAAGGVKDVAGNDLGAEAVLEGAGVFVMTGDVNRDRSVGFADLLTLAQNYNETGRTYSQGNLDYSPDGLVGFSDLLILAQRYGTSLIRSEPKPSVFGNRSIERRGLFEAEEAVFV